MQFNENESKENVLTKQHQSDDGWKIINIKCEIIKV